MAVYNPHLSQVRLGQFVEENRNNLPAVVEVVEGIYGSQEKDSEVRDFSNGDILRLLAVKEEVNITFDAVYSQASKKGLITVDKSFSGAQFKIMSAVPDGHVYKSVNALAIDSPDYVQTIKSIHVGGVALKKGDRLKLISKSTEIITVPFIECRVIRTSQIIKLSGDLNQCFAKKVDKSHEVLSLSDIYHRLPQRVRMVVDVGQAMRGIHHGIQGLDPDFDCEMNLSKIEIVEACFWENPDKLIRVPLTTDVDVYPRKDWGDKIGALTDIHDLARDAAPQSPKVAVVVDQQSVVSGCVKDTIIVVYGQTSVEYGLCEGENKALVFIPKKYPSKFKVCMETWCTVEELLRAGMYQEVRVGTTSKATEDDLDTLYENDVVKIVDPTTEVFNGIREELEVIIMQRDRSTSGRVGKIKVPTFAKANFYENTTVVADYLMSQLLDKDSFTKVTLSLPNVSNDQQNVDSNDDLLLRFSPLKILGQCEVNVALVKILKTSQSDDDHGGAVVIPEIKKLDVRSISRSVNDLIADDSYPQVNNIIIRTSMKEARLLQRSDSQLEDDYDVVPPPVPTRINKRPTRPPAPNPIDLITKMDLSNQESPPLPPPKDRKVSLSAPLSPKRSPSLPRSPKGSQLCPTSPTSATKKHPMSFVREMFQGFRVNHNSSRHTESSTKREFSTENKYNSIKEEKANRTTYEVTLKGGDSDSDDNYEKPDVISKPPGNRNIASYNLSDMLELLKHLDAGQRVMTTFINKNIDGRKLRALRGQRSDEDLRQYLGFDSMKDWYPLGYFIEKST